MEKYERLEINMGAHRKSGYELICAYPGCGAPFQSPSPHRKYCVKHYNGIEHDIPDTEGMVRGAQPSQQAILNRVREREELRADILREDAAAFLAQHKPLGPISPNLLATRIEDMGFDTPQEAVALFSDLHYGSKIDPRVTGGLAYYDREVADERLTRYRDGILRFTQMMQALMPVDTLHLLCLGDDIEGHGQMFGTQALQMTDSAHFQVLGLVDHMSGILLDLLQRYKHIKVYKVFGNHGRIAAKARDSYPPDNLELLAWNHIADRVRAQTGGEWVDRGDGDRRLEGGMIDFRITPSFLMRFNIFDFIFVIRHGHGIKGLQATYTGAIENKNRLNSVYGEVINYYIKAHLHEAQSAEHEIGGEILQNGCFVGPSLLSVEMSRAAANIPSQELFFMHPKHGKTHHHRIRLASVEEMRKYVH